MPDSPKSSSRIRLGVLLIVAGTVMVAMTLPATVWFGWGMIVLAGFTGLALVAWGLLQLIIGLRERAQS